jgi:hypothetical protein
MRRFHMTFRPYVARLSPGASYTEVLYPTPAGKLAAVNAASCGEGCAGPTPSPGAATLNPPWASTQGWFAVHDPSTKQGVVVRRRASFDPQGDAVTAQLWIDNDSGSDTNASSFLLMSAAAGFHGGLVIENETLCFYESTIWTPSLLPPTGCTDAPANLSPWSLTFGGVAIGAGRGSQSATLTNVGRER